MKNRQLGQTGRLPDRGRHHCCCRAVVKAGSRTVTACAVHGAVWKESPMSLYIRKGTPHKVTVFARSVKTRKLKPETYLLVEENGNLFINTGYRIDIAYNEAADVLTFSPNGDYVRKEVRP